MFMSQRNRFNWNHIKKIKKRKRIERSNKSKNIEGKICRRR